MLYCSTSNSNSFSPPPLPNSLLPTSKALISHGQRLMTLVRTVEKDKSNNDDCSNDDALEESITILQKLIDLYSRHGLLLGNSEKADKILEKNNREKDRHSSSSRRGGKRSRQKIGSDTIFFTEQQQQQLGSTTEQSANISAVVDESLVLTAVVRILSGRTSRSTKELPPSSSSTPLFDYSGNRVLQVALAADLCTAICEHVKACSVLTTCAVAEYELMAVSGKLILTGLVKSAHSLLMELSSTETTDEEKKDTVHLCLFAVPLDDDPNTMGALYSCLRAAASVVSMFGTKLARSTSLLSDIQRLGWTALTVQDHDIQHAAANLLATLPFVGDALDKILPSDLWTNAVMDIVVSISTLLTTMIPFNNQLKLLSRIWNVSDNVDKVMNTWIKVLRDDIEEQSIRCKALRFLVGGLSHYLQSLFDRDFLDEKQPLELMGAQLSIDRILDVIETMLSLSVASETLYFRTKKRLREETIAEGLLSPYSLVLDMSSHVQLVGHEMLICILNAVVESSLLPYARRIMKMTYASLLASSSEALRKVLDPGSSIIGELDRKKRRWLHTSIPVRSAAVRTFSVVILMFGSDPSTSSSSSQRLQGSHVANDVEKSIELVVGCLLEQLTWNPQQREENDDWGSLSERLELAVTSAESLDATIVSCGGFLPLSTRSLIDSVVSTGFSLLTTSAAAGINRLSSYTSLKISLLRLGSSCLSTPWPDGALSSIHEGIKKVASMCKYDGDVRVRKEAASSLRLCSSLETPRVPALHFIAAASSLPDASSNNAADHRIGMNSSSLFGDRTTIVSPPLQKLVDGLQTAKHEIAKREKQEEEEAAKEKEEKRDTFSVNFSDKKKRKRKKATVGGKDDETIPKAKNSKTATDSLEKGTKPESTVQPQFDDNENGEDDSTSVKVSKLKSDVENEMQQQLLSTKQDEEETCSTADCDGLGSKRASAENDQPMKAVQSESEDDEHSVVSGDDNDSDDDNDDVELPGIVDCGPDIDDIE